MNSDGVSLVRNGFASMVTLPSTPGPTPLLARLVTLLASQLVVRRSRTGQFRPFACTLEIHSLLRFKHRAVTNRLSTLLPARGLCATRDTITQGLFEDEQPGSGSHNL